MQKYRAVGFHIGSIQLSEKTELVVRMMRHTDPEVQSENGDSVDIRLRVDDGNEVKWSKKGIRFNASHLKDLIKLLKRALSFP